MGGDAFQLASLLRGCSDKNQCNLCGRKGVHSRLVLVKMVLQLMNQLACSRKGRTGNYFGTCKHKKGHGVKREENTYYWALSGEAKSIHSLPPTHAPLPAGELGTESPPLPSPPSRSDGGRALLKTNPWVKLPKYLALVSLILIKTSLSIKNGGRY